MDYRSRLLVPARDCIFYENLTLPVFEQHLTSQQNPATLFHGVRSFANADVEIAASEEPDSDGAREAAPDPPVPVTSSGIPEFIPLADAAPEDVREVNHTYLVDEQRQSMPVVSDSSIRVNLDEIGGASGDQNDSVNFADRGGEFSSALLGAFCRAQGIRQTFTLPASPQQNGIAERRIGRVMDVARTSMIHAAAPHFLWPFAVQYAAHQLNLQPRVSLPETSPTLLWTGKVGDAFAFWVWGSRAFVRNLSADRLSPRATPCVFLGFPPYAPSWQFYHPTSRRVLSSQDVTFDESVPYYRLFPYRTASLPPPPLFLAPGPPPVDPLPPQGPAPSGVSQVDAVEPVKVAVDSGAALGAEPAGAGSCGAGSGGAETEGVEPGGAEPGGAEPGGAEPGGAEIGGAEPWGAEPGGTEPGGAELGGTGSARVASRAGGTTAATGSGGTCLGDAGAAGPGGTAKAAGASGGAGAAGSAGTGAAGATGVGAAGATGVGAAETADVGPSEGAGARAVGAGGAAGTGAAAERTGAIPTGSGGATRPSPYFVPLLEQVLGLPLSPGPAPPCPQPVQSQSPLQPVSLLPAPSPYTGPTKGLAERRVPASRPASPARPACTSRRTSHPRPPAVPGTHQMTLRPSTAPLRVPLPSPPASSLPSLAELESDSLRAPSPTVANFLATVVTDPSLASTAASALVAELVDFAAHCRPDYAAGLVAESASVCPPSVGGEFALGTDGLEDIQEEFQCLAAALPHLVSTLLASEGDPDAPDIPTPRSYAEAIEGPYSSQWQAAMDAEMASWKSTGTYVDEVPPPGANIVSGMWIFRVKRPPGSPPVLKVRYVARGFSQRQGVDYFQTFSPTPKMTTLRVLLHVAAQRDYELHSLDFNTAFLQGSLHEEIWLRRPPGFTGSFPPGTQWSLRRPVYGLRQAPREWHDTLRTTLAAPGFAPSTADPSLFLRTDTSLPPFYVLVYVDDLVFATADTAGLAHVKSELQKRHTCTDLGELRSYLGLHITRDRAHRTITLTQSHMVQQVLQRFDFTYSSPQATPLPTRHSLSALPSDESVEPSGPYPELVGCLMYLMTCTRPDLAYPLSILARYVAPGRHRPEHMTAAMRVLRYLCSTSGMGLVLGGRRPVVLTGHADTSWADDQPTQRSSQGYTFSLGSGSVSWRSTRSSSVLSSSCEAEIYAGAMAAQELRWLTYLLTDLGEQPRSPPVSLQRGQLRLAYVASEANTADIFTKALPPGDHQRFSTMLACFALLDWSCDLLFSPTLPMGVATSSHVFAAASRSGPESAPCSCRLLSHKTLLWHHRLGHPSLPRLRGMASRVLVSGLPRSLPPLPQGPAPTCVPCVEGRQRAAPHSSEFPPTEAPLQTLHMDVWGPARVRGQGHERYFLLVVEDFSRYTSVFPLRRKDEVTEVLIDWIRVARLQLRERFSSDFPVLRLHFDRGGEFSSDLLRAFYRAESIRQMFTLPTSPYQNGIAERRIGMVMDVARTSMIHAAAPHFLWPFAVQYAAHQINLQPRVSMPETSPTLRWTGKIGDASAFRLYHPTSRRVLSSQDVMFDESVPYYRLFPYRAAPLPPPPLFLTPDAVELVEVAVDSGASGGAEPERAELGGAGPGGAEPERAEPGGAEPGGAESGGAEPAGAGPSSPSGALSQRELPSPQELREWFARRWSRAARAGGVAGAGGSTAAGGAGATGPGGARTGGTGAAGPGGATGGGATDGARAGCAAGVGATGGTCAGGAARSGAPVGAGVGATAAAGGGATAGGAAGDGADAAGAGAVPTGSGGATRPRPYFFLLLEQLQLASPLPAPSPYAGPTGGLAERREPESRSASPVRAARTSRCVPRQRPPAIPGTHQMALRPSTAPHRVPLPSPPDSSLPALAELESHSLHVASRTVTLFLVTDPSFESTAASALVAELLDFAAHCRLDYAASLVAESESVCPPSVGGECALSTDVLEDTQEEFQCFAAALPHLVSLLIAPEGDSDAPDIPTPRSYSEAIEGPYSSLAAPPTWLHLVDTLAALGFAPSTADPSLFLRTDTLLSPIYILVYVDDLVFATADTSRLAHVKSELQKRHTCTDLGPSSLRLHVLLASGHSPVYSPLALSSAFG
ncbi:unnamed protein product [Closterium sp. NIES-53]